MDDREDERVKSYFAFTRKQSEIEAVADAILEAKREHVLMDKKRQESREALRGIQRFERSNGGENNNNNKKVWLCGGDFFYKLPTDKAKNLINRDTEQVNKHMRELEDEMKEKNIELLKLEGESTVLAEAFKLKALSRDEIDLMQPD